MSSALTHIVMWSCKILFTWSLHWFNSIISWIYGDYGNGTFHFLKFICNNKKLKKKEAENSMSEASVIPLFQTQIKPHTHYEP